MTKKSGMPIINLIPASEIMNIGVYGILIVFGAFVLLLILNPNLSCFGKRIKSPLYPVFRRRAQRGRKKIRTEDYNFKLSEDKSSDQKKTSHEERGEKTLKTQDYGRILNRDKGEGEQSSSKTGRGIDPDQDE